MVVFVVGDEPFLVPDTYYTLRTHLDLSDLDRRCLMCLCGPVEALYLSGHVLTWVLLVTTLRHSLKADLRVDENDSILGLRVLQLLFPIGDSVILLPVA